MMLDKDDVTVGCFLQRHIYIELPPNSVRPHVDIWTLVNVSGWQEKREYLEPIHRAQVEQARRHKVAWGYIYEGC